MLGTDIIMSRALRHVLDENKLSLDFFKRATTDVKNKLQDLVFTVADDMKYNALKYFIKFY